MGADTLSNLTIDLLLDYGPVAFEEPMSLEAFTAFCERYPDLVAEREASGKVIIMTPVKLGSSENEGHIFGYLYAWNLLNQKPGTVLSPSGGFLLNHKELRCGDTSWVTEKRMLIVRENPNWRKEWIPLAPDFVAEVKSDSDRLKTLKSKMTDVWLANGVRLAWLIDPDAEIAYIYRQGVDDVEEVRDFDTSILSGEDVLPGFEFPLVELNL